MKKSTESVILIYHYYQNKGELQHGKEIYVFAFG